MAKYLSQNSFNDVLRQFVSIDPNLIQYGFGQLYHQNGEPKVSQRYPGLWTNPVRTEVMPGTINFNGGTMNRVYQILIYDVLTEDRSNENATISDCEEYALRLLRYLSDETNEMFNQIRTPIITPFSDKFLDDVSGVIIDITIEFTMDNSICTDPDYSSIQPKYNTI